MSRKQFAVISVIIILLAAGAAYWLWRTEQRPIGNATPVSVRLPIPIIEAGSAPFFVAQDRGYYAEEGLDVKFEMGSRELNPVKTVAAGTDTFGVLGGPDTLLVARSKGQPLKAIMVVHRNSNFPVLISLASSNVSEVEDLQGQRVGFFYGHISTDVLRNLFRKKNVQVTEVDVGFDYSQLLSGELKACWGFRTTAGLDLPAKGVEITMINPADAAGIISHGYTVFATEKTIAGDPELVERFVRATLRGIRYTVDHPEEANKSLLKRDPNLDEALSLKRLKMYNAVTSASEAYPPGYMDKDMFQSTYVRLREEGVIEKEFDVTAAFNDSRAHRLARWAFEGHPWHVIVSNGAFAALMHRILLEHSDGRAIPPYGGSTTTVEFQGVTVELPTRLLSLIARDDHDFDLLVEGIIEGPHHEVAANVIILTLLEALFDVAAGGVSDSHPVDGPEEGNDAATC